MLCPHCDASLYATGVYVNLIHMNAVCKRRKIAVVGSRGTPRKWEHWRALVYAFLRELPKDVVIISGRAPGIDTFAEEGAVEFGLDTLLIPAEWKKFGKKAGFIRNVDIVECCDEVWAFWDGVSRGTAHTMELARKMNKKVEVIPVS